ncbi:Uncharacterised protein [uncultured archaeon]|nr:Uncharacterised protein [uncultured archaeon]
MGGKWRLAIGIAVLVVAIAAVAARYFGIGPVRALDSVDFLLFLPLALIILFAAYLAWDRGKALKAGLPATDELGKRAAYKAGYYAFMVALWSALAAGMLDFPANYVVGAVVISSAVAFAAAYVYLIRKGKVD